MNVPLSQVKFTQSVKIREEVWYCRDQDYHLHYDEERNLVRAEDRKGGQVAFIPMHNVVYFWEKTKASPNKKAS